MMSIPRSTNIIQHHHSKNVLLFIPMMVLNYDGKGPIFVAKFDLGAQQIVEL